VNPEIVQIVCVDDVTTTVLPESMLTYDAILKVESPKALEGKVPNENVIVCRVFVAAGVVIGSPVPFPSVPPEIEAVTTTKYEVVAVSPVMVQLERPPIEDVTASHPVPLLTPAIAA
jgi:hypothetical protein